MIVPQVIQFQAIPVAGVYSPDAAHFFMKLDPNSAVDLATAAIIASIPPTQANTYFPAASLNLG